MINIRCQKFKQQDNEEFQVHGGAFDQAVESETPFGFGRGEGFDKGSNETGWVVTRERYKADEIFDSLDPVDGKITGECLFYHVMYVSSDQDGRFQLLLSKSLDAADFTTPIIWSI